MNAIHELRRKADLTQAELAGLAGTSQPTIAAYEAGRKSPTLQTLSRIARAVGLESVITFVPSMTREDRRSLALHRAIANRLIAQPDETLEHARRNLALMKEKNPHAHRLFNDWLRILTLPVDEIISAMFDPDLHGRELRKATPFAGVLSDKDREKLYKEFARRDIAA